MYVFLLFQEGLEPLNSYQIFSKSNLNSIIRIYVKIRHFVARITVNLFYFTINIIGSIFFVYCNAIFVYKV